MSLIDLYLYGKYPGDTMDNVLIREITPQDIEAIFQLDSQWDQENIAHEFIYVSRAEFMADLERFQAYFLVAESEGRIVGYINGSVRLSQGLAVIPEQEPYLEIENIYVKPEFRNRHIGGNLIERLLEIAEQIGIQRFLVSTVSKEMDKTLNFYRRHGFKPWYVQMFK
jgi:ribosomal protein S18 acetylase RimI-like enzyme